MYKVNPPLRSQEDVRGLLYCILRGEVNWIETDHAPHAVGEKLFLPHCSGFPSLYIYKDLLDFLLQYGISWERIDAMTYGNIKRIFGYKLEGI